MCQPVMVLGVYVQLKQKCSDDHSKMQAMLPELLESYGVPHFEVSPVYNPRWVVVD